MAKKVEPEKQLINRLIKYSKGHVRDNSFFMGGDGKSKPLHNWSLDPNQLREETKLKISNLMNDENLENSHLYKGDNEEIRNLCKTIKEKISSLPLDTLYFKQLANISDFISKLSRTIFDYERDYAKATSEVAKSAITNNTKQALEGYIQALEKANCLK